MFGRKARRIEELKAFGEIAQGQFDRAMDTAEQRLREIKILKESIVGLTADRDAARSALDSLQNDFKILGSNHENRGGLLSSALADRDQFAKRIEELEAELVSARWKAQDQANPIYEVSKEILFPAGQVVEGKMIED